ncbi:MAG: membrane protein insertase YidC [Acidithiobacillus sp.]|uniref:membrane protein insertase YidC n=1 Tax=Acidithiobacillus sp. TaxID=1872118 RepID=UPI003D03AD47
MDTQRTLLAVVLSVIVLVLYEQWMAPKPSHPGSPTAAAQSATAQAAPRPAATVPTASSAAATAVAGSTVIGLAGPAQLAAAPTVSFATRVYQGSVSLVGGDIVHLGLKRYPTSSSDSAPYPILTPESSRLTLQQSGFRSLDGQVLQGRYRLLQDTGHALILQGEAGPLRVEKTLEFAPDSYLIHETIRVTNGGSTDWNGSYLDQILRNDRSESHWFMSIFTGAVLMHNGSFSEKSFSDLRSHPEEWSGSGWAGMTDHYFLQAILPDPKATGQIYARSVGPDSVAGVALPLPRLAPGQSTTIEQDLYLGPKEQKTLTALGRGLEQTVDYGWFAIIAEPMHGVLSWFHSWTGNWGLAIVLLVLAVKILFFYPSAISYRSMANMRKLQPKLEQIKKLHGEDRQKMGAAMMELYRSEKVNPMAGCLPIVIQMPVFIALYWVLVESVSLRMAPFVLWIHDLAAPDPYYILPLLMGVSMFIQQRLNPAPMDPMQKKILSALPVIFAIFFSFFPAGLVLYWLTNNVVSIAQQYLITRHVMKEA